MRVGRRICFAVAISGILAAASAWAQAGGHIAGGRGAPSAPSRHFMRSSSAAPHHSSSFKLNNGCDGKRLGFGGTPTSVRPCFVGFGILGSSWDATPDVFARCNPIWKCWPAAPPVAAGGLAASKDRSPTSSSRAKNAPAPEPSERMLSLGELARKLKLRRAEQSHPTLKLYTNDNLPKR